MIFLHILKNVHVIHGVLKEQKCVILQYGKGKMGGKIVNGDSDNYCDSYGSAEFPLFTKRTSEDVGITPIKEMKKQMHRFDQVPKQRSLNKMSKTNPCRAWPIFARRYSDLNMAGIYMSVHAQGSNAQLTDYRYFSFITKYKYEKSFIRL